MYHFIVTLKKRSNVFLLPTRFDRQGPPLTVKSAPHFYSTFSPEISARVASKGWQAKRVYL